GRFDNERIPLELKDRKGNVTMFTTDEHVRTSTSIEDLQKLVPVFAKDGTVTAGNSSGITDGAAAVTILSEAALQASDAQPLARILDYEIVGVPPEVMGIGPVPAVRAILMRQNISLADIDLIEINEAFAAQVIACDRDLRFDPERLNVNGGAIALGHPIGCTGVRITTTLLHEMKKRQSKRGLATLCISGGMGIALLVERV
ncbi:MAG TPA: acetyl-CoA C-acyltransferase, partial [Pyrinomonadaceae bacterium]|nr:acetyl-CoA C-acyltransferase [Pyrinomonadaceae bacterium]